MYIEAFVQDALGERPSSPGLSQDVEALLAGMVSRLSVAEARIEVLQEYASQLEKTVQRTRSEELLSITRAQVVAILNDLEAGR